MDLQKLSQEAFETAKAHSWHDNELPDEHWLMLIITEIAEAVQADRKNLHANTDVFKSLTPYNANVSYSDTKFIHLFSIFIKNSVEDELCDIIIRCLDLAALRGISLQYVDEFLAGGVNAITDPFPIVMYHLCEELTLYKECLCEKLNAVIALIIAYCRQNGIDIDFFVEQKMRFNKLRDYKHGNKKY